jgi:hypothetical protein
MRLISYQAINKLEFPKKDRKNGNLDVKLFWNQVWKTKNFKPNLKLAVEPNVKLITKSNESLRIEPNAKLRIEPKKEH